jgi:hypothetical protein
METANAERETQLSGAPLRYFPKCELFGLHCGQYRGPGASLHGYWYDRSGENIGCGDLSTEDFRRISARLEDDDLFVITETAPPPNLDDHPTAMSASGRDARVAMFEKLAKTCRCIVARGRLYYVKNYSQFAGSFQINGLRFQTLTLAEAKRMLIQGQGISD